MTRFILVLVITASALAYLVSLAYKQLWIESLPSFFFETLIFLVFSTTTIFAYLYKVEKPDFFVQLYLLTMAVKLLAYGAYNLFMIIEDRPGASVNVIFFLLLYTVFTGLEITFLYRKISGPRGS